MKSYEAGLKTKEAILDACIKLVSQYGFENVTFKMISDETGILPGSIAYHYKSKNELFQTVFYDYTRRIFDFARAEIQRLTGGSCPDYLLEMFSIYINYYMAFSGDNYRFFMGAAILKDAFSYEDYYNSYLTGYSSFVELNKDDPAWLLNLSACFEADNGLLLNVMQNIEQYREKYTFQQIAEYSIRLIGRFFTVNEVLFEQAIGEVKAIVEDYDWSAVPAAVCR